MVSLLGWNYVEDDEFARPIFLQSLLHQPKPQNLWTVVYQLGGITLDSQKDMF